MYVFGPVGMSRLKVIFAIDLSQMIAHWPRLGGRYCGAAEELAILGPSGAVPWVTVVTAVLATRR